jgi:uncharacterized cupin superfamily protein
MATIIKSKDLRYKHDEHRVEHYDLLTASPRLSKAAGSENLVFDLRILNPGQFSFPYHFHRHAEELMMVTSGSMTVRMPEGFEIVSAGDLVFFEKGATGAHQFFNHGDEPCAYLDIRTFFDVDVSEYPDSGKINILPTMDIFKKESAVHYFQGEEDMPERWKKLREGE